MRTNFVLNWVFRYIMPDCTRHKLVQTNGLARNRLATRFQAFSKWGLLSTDVCDDDYSLYKLHLLPQTSLYDFIVFENFFVIYFFPQTDLPATILPVKPLVSYLPAEICLNQSHKIIPPRGSAVSCCSLSFLSFLDRRTLLLQIGILPDTLILSFLCPIYVT